MGDRKDVDWTAPIIIGGLLVVIFLIWLQGVSSATTQTSAPSIQQSVQQDDECKTFNPVRTGWLQDHDQRGEIALWRKAAQPFQNGNTIAATVPLYASGLPAGSSIIVEAFQECYVDFVLYYYVDAGEGRRGWVDVDYFYWSRP